MRILHAPKYMLWPALIRWITTTRWTLPRKDAREEVASGSTWVELALVFMQQTGMRLGGADTELANAARIMATCFRAAAKLVRCRNNATAAAGLFRAVGQVASVQPILGYCLPGINRRPCHPYAAC